MERILSTRRLVNSRWCQRFFFTRRKRSPKPFHSKYEYNVIKKAAEVTSGPKSVPEHIERPPYITDPSYSSPAMVNTGRFDPTLLFCLDDEDHCEKKDHNLKSMRTACLLARDVLDYAGTLVSSGTTTEEIDECVHKYIVDHNAYPSPLQYAMFPKSVCTSVNNVIVHGIPDLRPLEDGDIIKIDVSVYLNGYHGDNCATFVVGDSVDEDAEKLVTVTASALDEAIAVCGPNVPFNAIGSAIEAVADANGLTVCTDWIGHGVGKHFHCPPCVYHHRNNYTEAMQVGQVFTIEPCLSLGSGDHFLLPDQWTALTEDSSRAAQFEHTLLITDMGAEVLTVPSSTT
eukprot:m.39706 g.39706  ORF g.39706 m.39706 type:complete len:343 (+) comp10305_c0_seq1:26-1054(+)